MSTIQIILILIAVAVTVAVLAKTGSGGDITIPEAPQRSDLLFGYYGCTGEQVAETKGHVNLHEENWWDGLEKGIQNIREADMFTVIDLDAEVLTDTAQMQQWKRKQAGLPPLETTEPRTVRTDGEQRLRALFTRLRNEGLLHLVKACVPCDEPNLPEAAAIHLMPEAVALIRRVASEFSELDGLKVGVIYYSDLPMEHVELFNVVGFDDYDAKSSIFAPGAMYDQLVERLRPDQQTWLIPGAYKGQDPTPFLNKANGSKEVLAIVAFRWGNPHGDPAPGIEDMPEMRAKYEAIGRTITGKTAA